MAYEHPDENVFSLGGQVRRMWQDMYLGNGKPGMTTRMQAVEEAVKEFKDGQKWIIRLLVSALILAVLNMVIHR